MVFVYEIDECLQIGDVTVKCMILVILIIVSIM